MSFPKDVISVVPFLPQYTTQVIDLIVTIQQKEFELPITAKDQPDLHDIHGFYRKGRGNFWVALDQQKVAGTIALIDLGDGQAALRKMFVERGYRGESYGTARLLLGTLLGWAQQHGMKEIYLGTTAKFLAAHRFYEKNGFAEISMGELPEGFPIMKVDTKFYRYMVI